MSNSETGNAKNVANFEDLIAFCAGYSTDYNPTNTNITIPAMQNIINLASTAVEDVRKAKAALDKTTNAREIAFAPVKKLSSRIVSWLESTTVAKQMINDVKTINNKIHGRRAAGSPKVASRKIVSTPENGEGTVPKTISVSQQSYDGIVDNFSKLILVLSMEPQYVPNETEFKLTTLSALLTKLRASNTDAINAIAAYSNAMIARNTILYQPGTGLLDLALEVKKYVKSVYGPGSPQYKQLTGLDFKKIKI